MMPEVEMTEEELQHRLNHSSAGGRHAALKDVVDLLRTKAGAFYVLEREIEARLLREIANEVDQMRVVASAELQKHIAQMTSLSSGDTDAMAQNLINKLRQRRSNQS